VLEAKKAVEKPIVESVEEPQNAISIDDLDAFNLVRTLS
jgi:hypothetical protein